MVTPLSNLNLYLGKCNPFPIESSNPRMKKPLSLSCQNTIHSSGTAHYAVTNQAPYTFSNSKPNIFSKGSGNITNSHKILGLLNLEKDLATTYLSILGIFSFLVILEL